MRKWQVTTDIWLALKCRSRVNCCIFSSPYRSSGEILKDLNLDDILWENVAYEGVSFSLCLKNVLPGRWGLVGRFAGTLFFFFCDLCVLIMMLERIECYGFVRS